MKHIFVVYLGLIVSMTLITNNQLVADADNKFIGVDPCKSPNPPSTCASDPKAKVGSSAANNYSRGCSDITRCNRDGPGTKA